jgi:hypothetical protein
MNEYGDEVEGQRISVPYKGWVIFDGADEGVPFDNPDTLIFVLYRDGIIVGPRRAQRFRWVNGGDHFDVLAYCEAGSAVEPDALQADMRKIVHNVLIAVADDLSKETGGWDGEITADHAYQAAVRTVADSLRDVSKRIVTG